MDQTVSNLTEEINTSLLEESVTISVCNSSDFNAYETSVKLNNIYKFDWDRFLPNKIPLTLTNFYELTSQIVSRQQDLEGILSDKKIRVVEDYPYADMESFGEQGIIVFRTISREPAGLGKDGISYKQKSWRYYFELTVPEIPKHRLIVENRPIAHKVEFSVWAKTARIANQRAIWLERLLIDNSWQFKVKGADRFIWDGRLADTYMNVSGQPLFQRPNRFTVILNEFRVTAEPLTSEINIEIQPFFYETLSTAQAIIYNKLNNLNS